MQFCPIKASYSTYLHMLLMNSLAHIIVPVLVSLSCVSPHDISYVKPDDYSSSSSCPSQPCLTLDQYTQEASTYFTTGSTFVFLAGNHTGNSALTLTSVSSLSLKSDLPSFIFCQSNFTIICNHVSDLTIDGLHFIFSSKSRQRSALLFSNSWNLLVSRSTFQGTGDIVLPSNRAVSCAHSTITINGCYFEGIVTRDTGGAIRASQGSNVTLTSNLFARNTAYTSGGSIHAYGHTSMLMVNNTFQHNVAGRSGGAIECDDCFLNMSGSHVFESNRADREFEFGTKVVAPLDPALQLKRDSGIHSEGLNDTYYSATTLSKGGAIRIHRGIFILYGDSNFTGNEAVFGGSMHLLQSSTIMKEGKMVFENNAAVSSGGAIYNEYSKLTFHADGMYFSGNSAKKKGGALAIIGNNSDFLTNMSGSFLRNTAGVCGGGVFVHKTRIMFVNVSVANNTGSGLCVSYSKAWFMYASIANNTGKFGGGIYSENSVIAFPFMAVFAGNEATTSGGAISSLYGRVNISGSSIFKQNTAQGDGGAIFAQGSDIMMNGTIRFVKNTAQNGGAVCLRSLATVSITALLDLSTSYNHATEYGGVVYNEDNAMPSQCNFMATKLHHKNNLAPLPYCFLQLMVYLRKLVTVFSNQDFADKDGDYLYGGLLDRCKIPVLNSDIRVSKSGLPKLLKLQLRNLSSKATLRAVASEPYQLCFCSRRGRFDCFGSRSFEVYRGQKFTLSLVALDQMINYVSTTVTSKTGSNAWVLKGQRTQTIHQNCTDTEYQLYSTRVNEELILYPDGPCRDIGWAKAVVNVTFKPCPIGFMQSGGMCVCEDRLQKYHANCIIDADHSIIRPGTQSQFWVGTLYLNNSYRGLIVCEACPVEYCRRGDVSITLQNLNSQCAHKHSGVLCGSCETNHSFLLGSSHCGECPNSFQLALLLPFAAAGIALVMFLSVLKLTVATGMINGVILYANIVQINRISYFLPVDKRNILTVFIAWLNLDLGFETCFYKGMDAYAQTWLQFAFPLYVWVLISSIIIISRYSFTVSSMIGRNPVAVLATLLLMSYAKIVKTSIEVYSFAVLDYPENRTAIVWLKDGNISFFEPLQILLTVATSLVIFLLFLPYTFLLLLSFKLYRFSGRKCMRWLNRLKPFLDSYYAPYKRNTRYWTGFLLVVRCILYLIFSSSPDTYNNGAVIITFSTILTISLISGGIYSRNYTNMLEAVTYLNLITLSAATLAGFNSSALVHTLVGIVFATMVGIVVFHFARLPKVAACLKRLYVLKRHSTAAHALITDTTPVSRIPTPSRQVTRSEVCLREPLLDD